MTALSTALIAGSVQAMDYSISGGASISYTSVNTSSDTNPWGMGDSITFSTSGDLDNGMTVSVSLEMDDHGSDAIDDKKITIDTGNGVIGFATSIGGIGGIGKRTTIAGPSYAIGSNGPGPTLGGWIAGGGGGQSYPGSTDGGGGGGGAPRTSPPTGKDRLVNNWAGGGSGMDGTSSGPLPTSTLRNMRGLSGTGGGGGGSYGNIAAGNGGSGVVALRYQIGQITATAKATGGSVTYFAPQTKVIHSFSCDTKKQIGNVHG